MSLVWQGLLGLGEAGAATVWMPEQAATGAADHDALFYFIYWVCVIFFVATVGAMFYFVVKYRRRSPNQRTSPIRGNFKLEVAWSVLPAILLMVMFVWGFRGFIESAVPPANAMEVRVLGRQWSWTFEYPQGFPSDELVVPVNTPVRLTMTSDDVLHSFFVPAFRVKRDLVPGRYTVLWFEANRTGVFQVFCAEYCGHAHSNMLSRVRVLPQEEYQAWVNSAGGAANLAPADYGARLFQINPCFSCHNTAPDMSGPVIGPSLWGAFGRQERMADDTTITVDEDYIRESILNPTARTVAGYEGVSMPAFQGALNEQQISALIEFIKTLREPGGTE